MDFSLFSLFLSKKGGTGAFRGLLLLHAGMQGETEAEHGQN